MSIKIETEHYRTYMSRLDDQGRGHTMGALFWQLNDVWVAPSWAAIDYTGRWKMLHYFVPGFFSQEIVTGLYNADKNLEIFHILNKAHGDGEKWLNLTVYAWDSFTPVNVTKLSLGNPVRVTSNYSECLRYCFKEALTATSVATIDVDQYLSDAGCGSLDDAKYNCFFHMIVGIGTTTITPPNYFFPSKFKEAKLQTSSLEIIAVDNFDAEGLRFLIAVKAPAPSLFVWLDAHEVKGHFLENGFVQHSIVAAVIFVADEPTTEEQLKGALTVTHVKDAKYFS
jgi:beta-mannosidase